MTPAGARPLRDGSRQKEGSRHSAPAQERVSIGTGGIFYAVGAGMAPALRPRAQDLPGTVVIDHMGRPDIGARSESQPFGRFLSLIEDEKFRSKVSGAERLTVDGPPYEDVVPFARRIVEATPDRVLRGNDWPHPNKKSHHPDDGLLVDRVPVIAPTEELRRKLLVDNPVRLYWSD